MSRIPKTCTPKSPRSLNNLLSCKEKQKLLEAIFIKCIKLGDVKTFEHCISKNVNPNITFDFDYTALHIVAEYGSILIAKRLLKLPNIIIDPISVHGFTPLLLASVVGNIHIMILLLEHGADVHKQDHFGRTALHLTVLQKNINATLVLLQAKANPNQFDGNGCTPLHSAAVMARSYSLTLILLKYGADPTISLPEQLNVFFELCLGTHEVVAEKILEVILKKVPNVDMVDSYSGRTGLHFTALSNYTPTIKLLLDKGANRHLKDSKGYRPVDVARLFHHWDAANFLDTYIPQRERFLKAHVTQDLRFDLSLE